MNKADKVSMFFAAVWALGIGGNAGEEVQNFYVAPAVRGSGSGATAADAALYTDPNVWSNANRLLEQGPVTVWLADGQYDTDPLVLSGLGREEHAMTIRGGDSSGVELSAPVDHMVGVLGCRNLVFENLNFTGPIKGYGLRITALNAPSQNILVRNCNWYDLVDLTYGGTGVHRGSHHVSFDGCTFRRLGYDSHCHMIYNAYNADYVSVVNCCFEDCSGTYVRFRGSGSDFGTVSNCTFLSTGTYEYWNSATEVFIGVPVFNDVNPGDEMFGNHFLITDNTFRFTEASSAIRTGVLFHHGGYDPPGWNYLMTAEEGAILNGMNGSATRALLKKNCGLDLDLLVMEGNVWENVNRKVQFTSQADYGAVSKGWEGSADITEVLRSAGIISDDFEEDLAGNKPAVPSVVRPTTIVSNVFAKVVDSSVNTAGSGNAAQLYDDDPASSVVMEYNFVTDADSQISLVRTDFTFSCLDASGVGDDYIATALGAYSTAATFSSMARQFVLARLYNDGTIDFTSASGANSTGHDVSTGSHQVSIFVNDYDSQAISYTGPDGISYALPANSVAYWLDGQLIITTLMDLNDVTVGGTVGSSENNLGKFGFSTVSTHTNLSYVVDDILVTTNLSSDIRIVDTYDQWLTFYSGMDALNGLTNDPDQDGIENLLEYALGGNPLIDDAAAVLPICIPDCTGGWLNYVYNRRVDDGLLIYEVMIGDVLNGPFTGTAEETGALDLGNGFETVTSRISTAVSSAGFMRLDVSR